MSGYDDAAHTADPRSMTGIAVLPEIDEHTRQAIRQACGTTVPLEQAQALLWTTSSLDGFPSELPDDVRWVQLSSAGVERWIETLDAGQPAGAALDVTDPEPLPDGDLLWQHSNVIVTPHVANPLSALQENLRLRIAENLTRFTTDQPLLGVIDMQKGY